MLNKADNAELDAMAVKAQAGDESAREEIARRLYPIAMILARRFFEEWSSEYLTRRELAQECMLQFFQSGLRNYRKEAGSVVAYFSGLCVWTGCKKKTESMAGRRGGVIKGVHVKLVRVDGLPMDADCNEPWDVVVSIMDHGQRGVDIRDSVRAAEERSNATETQWRVLRLVYGSGMTYREAGEYMGLTVRQVDNMLQKLQGDMPYDPEASRK